MIRPKDRVLQKGLVGPCIGGQERPGQERHGTVMQYCTNPLRGNLVVTTSRLTPVPIPVSQSVAPLVVEISCIVARHEQHNTG